MAALLHEELAEIYSTPTTKGWHKPKSKGTSFVLIAEVILIQWLWVYIYTLG
jgi:hypothetical protein